MALQFDDQVMVEQFIAGRELTVGILGDVALPVGEIIPKHEIYDYECKYTPGMAEERFPADLTADEATRIQQEALAAFRALKLSGYARIDFRLAADGTLYFIEANPNPEIAKSQEFAGAALHDGLDYPGLLHRILALGISRANAGTSVG